jgi:hypothetical protein
VRGARRYGSPDERRERALTFLAQLCVLPAGYRVRGVYGWAHAEDFDLLAGPYRWADLLAGMDHARLVEMQPSSLVDALEPARLYRITQAGMDEIAAVLREESPRVELPRARGELAGVYTSVGARWALEALREAPGAWLCAERVRAWCNRTGGRPYRLVWTSHLDELVSAALAEARPLDGCGKERRGARVYRATQSGLVVPVVKWFGRDPESEVYSQDGGPLLRAPLRCFLYGSGN